MALLRLNYLNYHEFFRKFWVNTISICKINIKQVVWKHLSVIYPRLLPIFSINRAGWGDEGMCQRFCYVTDGGGILLTLRTVTRGGRRVKFWPKTTLHNVWMIPYEKSLPEVIDLSIFGRHYFGLNEAITKI